MYSFDIARSRTATPEAAQEVKARVPRVVCWIGLSSLLADVAAESVASALPLFMLAVLQLSPLQLGLLDGLYQGGASLVRVASGFLADRWQSPRGVAMAGYALSLLSRLGLLWAGSAGLLVAALSLALDRIGKGIRTAPRDALIAAHANPGQLTIAFGVHRALDAAGALVGPLVAFVVLWQFPLGFNSIFAISAAFGLAGLFVFNGRVAPARLSSARDEPLSLRGVWRELRECRVFVRLSLLATLLSVFTVSDGLIYLGLQRDLGLDAKYMPLMFCATAGVFLVAAAPLGRLGDMGGAIKVFLGGYGVLAVLYLLLAFGPPMSPLSASFVVAALGVHYAATDGVLAACACAALPVRVRTTGLALLTTGTGLARIASSVGFGWLWGATSSATAMGVFALGMTACCAMAVSALRLPALRARP